MDILMPPLSQQPAPAPWLLRRGKINLARLIDAILAEKPEAMIDEVVAQLGCWGVQVSGIVVGMSQRDSAIFDTTDATPMLVDKSSDDFSRTNVKPTVHWESAL